MSDEFPMTKTGKEALDKELEQLVKVEREQVKVEIAEARAHGDLKENAEYHAAREQQSFAEGRIQALESALSSGQIIDVTSLNVQDRVVFGAKVELEDLETEEIVIYQIVGDIEADIKLKKIAVSSPISRALVGKEVGDVAVVKAPNGLREYEIISATYTG